MAKPRRGQIYQSIIRSFVDANHPGLPTTAPLAAPAGSQINVEEGTVDEGTSSTSANPFTLTHSVICSPNHLESILPNQSSRPHDIPLQHLKDITSNFSDERILGKGGSGVVYKGVLQNGEIIAVKKIVSSLMPGLQKQFESEVYHLMMLNHTNIVRCVGYCYEIKNECLEYNGKYVFAEMAERLLCLEYLPNGSLDRYISDESSGLDWSTRYKIIEGICYGLRHLHEENGKPIIHLDLKPANILLDDGMVPKITDFGLSRLLDQQQTICTTSRDGTFGYMAPEFLRGGTITPKSDIFSLGVIMMEIITGHRDYPYVAGTSSDDFVKLVLGKWKNELKRSPRYGSLKKNCEQIKRCVEVGLICVNPDRTRRPQIAKVINMLQGWEGIDCHISNEEAT
ncbi:hypothetical protein QYE76_043534 [Lolium multiflorum]|uniref:Protein kinase domain-containing protein n=1 Tax=Lolium multiflorum TaxID=4521 RepID=A0AAD8THK2_LOLMU|nr:hypothetical protein QYE76_043534 [Lolium multiflorum]